MSKETTDFGYCEIPTDQKTKRVTSVFRSVAPKYDLMNDLMSFGLHRFWKRVAIARCHIRPNDYVLDLAGGTGDLSLQAASKLGKEGKIVLADINEAMLAKGREKLLDQGIVKPLSLIQVNAEELPFMDHSFDRILMAFGLRNVTYKEKALCEMLRILKPGGRMVILEFSNVSHKPLKALYDAYSFSILPRLGKWISGDSDSYRYLAESIRKHPNQETLKSMIEHAGFSRAEYQNLNSGIVALHIGYKF